MSKTGKNQIIQDSVKGHWVNRAPLSLRPYLQLSRLDRPVGYWLLALPGWIGLAFATLSYGFEETDIKWAMLILIGAIAMRGAGCTYNDIVDQDLDKQVERTALRPLPAGTVTTKQAWIWLFAQCFIGLIVLLCLPRLAQIISLCSIPLVAAYPIMKRITWWPQIWLGFTFNWAVLVAYAAKTGEMNPALLLLYLGLVFWTVGYDTIYACQDIEDDAMVGIKSTARRFGNNIKLGVGFSYSISLVLILSSAFSLANRNIGMVLDGGQVLVPLFFGIHLIWQTFKFAPKNPVESLRLFKSNFYAGLLLALSATLVSLITTIVVWFAP
jgi:4-hydroxybenzoate polyprenyltransferase